MRTRAIVASLFALALASAASAQTEARRTSASVRVGGYADDDSTLVLRPRAAVRVLEGEWLVGGAYTADVISSASIDVVTRASRPIEEARHQLDAQLSWASPGEGPSLELGAGYTFAIEPDFDTHALTLTAASDLDGQRLWQGGLALSLSTNGIGNVADPNFDARNYSLGLAVSLARVLDPRAVLRASLEGGVTGGFQASPYRTVRLGDWSASPYTGTDPSVGAYVFTDVTGIAREAHPDLRLRARATVELLGDLGENVALLGRVGGYADDWAVLAFDATAEARWEPIAALLFRLGARAYVQSEAWFWRRRYADLMETDQIVTDDKELGAMRSYTAWLAASIPAGELRFDARVDLTRYEYPGFTLLTERHALAVEIGATWAP